MRLPRPLRAAPLAVYLAGCGATSGLANDPAGPAQVHIAVLDDPPTEPSAKVDTGSRPSVVGAGIGPGPVQVVAIQTDDADDEADALTGALRAAVEEMPRWAHGSWSLAPGDWALEVLELALKCSDPPDTACQARIADMMKSDRYIWGTLQKKIGGRVGGTVHLWMRGKGTFAYELDYSSNLTNPDDKVLRNLATEALQRLFAGLDL